ncbi:MAG: hypothetical protein IKV03_04005 [Alphaproteobacteria bacterium]|nr:hypothetical protein [Alphaproteobacteria bacterium]
MKLLKQLLKRMYHDYAVMFSGIDAKQAQQASVLLRKSGVPQIPTDYIVFLTLTDGLSWNGLELYSLSEHERDNGSFKYVGLLQSFDEQSQNPLLKNKLILGQAPEELIAYYPVQNEYQILDRYTYQVILKLPRFFDVLYFYTGHLTESSNK